MALSSTIYNLLFKRNSIYVGAIFGATFAFQAGFDSAITSYYVSHNKGKLWADVKQQLAAAGDDDEEEDDE